MYDNEKITQRTLKITDGKGSKPVGRPLPVETISVEFQSIKFDKI